jgi:hypothetical protein
LEVAIKQNSGKNLENNLMSIEGPNPLIEGQVHIPQIILPNTTFKRSKIDIDDIFGIK